MNWLLVVPSLDLLVTFNGRTPNSRAAEVDSTSLSRLFDAVTEQYVACDGTVVNGDTPPPENQAPVASFGSSCTALACGFTDTSNDPDGAVTAWSWSFGDGATSSEPSPGHTYGAPGTYVVRLTVTDDSSATATAERSVAVTAVTGVTLQAKGRKRNGFAFVDLTWSGARGESVRVNRDGSRLTTTANDGAYTDATGRTGTPTFRYRVCEVGTGVCSNLVTVKF